MGAYDASNSGTLRTPTRVARGSTRYRVLYLTQWEDSILAAGGLVAAVSADLTPAAIWFVVGGLVLAGVGKSLPSLIAQFWLKPTSPFPADSGWRHKLLPTGSTIDWVAVIGDLWLLASSLFALVSFHSAHNLVWFLAAIGVGFVGKAVVDLVELGFLAAALDTTTAVSQGSPTQKSADPLPTPSSSLGSATTESVVFGALGAGTLGLLALHFASTEPSAGLALGLAALGKAVPSFLSAAAGASGPSK